MAGKILEFPIRNPTLFSPEVNYQVLTGSEFNRILIAAIRALPHVNDVTRREELKPALCDFLLEKSLQLCPAGWIAATARMPRRTYVSADKNMALKFGHGSMLHRMIGSPGHGPI